MLYYDGRTGKFYTGWYYDYSFTGNNIMQQVTYAVALHLVMELLGLIPALDPIMETAEVAAQALLSASISTVYWEKDIYHVNQVTYPGMQLYGSFIGERTYVRFYANSARTQFIESAMYEWRDSAEWPSGVSIGSA